MSAQQMFTLASLAFAVVALASGLLAAHRWYDSTKVRANPGWDYTGSGGHIEPVIPQYRSQDLEVANMEATMSTADFNRKAAGWTTASVIFAAASAITGALSNL